MFKIETWVNNKILRTKSENVKKDELNKYSKLWKKMLKYIKDPENWGVWLAAPQIWISKNIIAVHLLESRESEKNHPKLIMINPIIQEHSETTETDTEWCLSIPWEKWEVKRFKTIKISFLDMKWSNNNLVLNWLAARIVQHEVDHLNWILFTDKI